MCNVFRSHIQPRRRLIHISGRAALPPVDHQNHRTSTMLPNLPQFSFQTNGGPPLRANQMRETWVAYCVTRESWYSTTVSVFKRFDLHCAQHEFPSSWRQYSVKISTSYHSINRTTRAWVFEATAKGQRTS